MRDIFLNVLYSLSPVLFVSFVNSFIFEEPDARYDVCTIINDRKDIFSKRRNLVDNLYSAQPTVCLQVFLSFLQMRYASGFVSLRMITAEVLAQVSAFIILIDPEQIAASIFIGISFTGLCLIRSTLQYKIHSLCFSGLEGIQLYVFTLNFLN